MTISFHMVYHSHSIIHSFVFLGCIYYLHHHEYNNLQKKPAEPESKIGVFGLGDKFSDKIK
jgi:hypothetical protein